jgi:hypothetical protein
VVKSYLKNTTTSKDPEFPLFPFFFPTSPFLYKTRHTAKWIFDFLSFFDIFFKHNHAWLDRMSPEFSPFKAGNTFYKTALNHYSILFFRQILAIYLRLICTTPYGKSPLKRSKLPYSLRGSAPSTTVCLLSPLHNRLSLPKTKQPSECLSVHRNHLFDSFFVVFDFSLIANKFIKELTLAILT